MKSWLIKALKELLRKFVVEFLWKVAKAFWKAMKVFLEELERILREIIRR